MAKEYALSEYAKFEEHRRNEEAIHSEKELRETLQKLMINREPSDFQET